MNSSTFGAQMLTKTNTQGVDFNSQPDQDSYYSSREELYGTAMRILRHLRCRRPRRQRCGLRRPLLRLRGGSSARNARSALRYSGRVWWPVLGSRRSDAARRSSAPSGWRRDRLRRPHRHATCEVRMLQKRMQRHSNEIMSDIPTMRPSGASFERVLKACYVCSNRIRCGIRYQYQRGIATIMLRCPDPASTSSRSAATMVTRSRRRPQSLSIPRDAEIMKVHVHQVNLDIRLPIHWLLGVVVYILMNTCTYTCKRVRVPTYAHMQFASVAATCLHMYMYLYTCIHVHVHAHIHTETYARLTCMHAHTHTCMRVHIHTYTHVRGTITHICLYTCSHIRKRTFTSTHVPECTYTRIDEYTHVHTDTYTHTQVHIYMCP